MLRLQSIPVEQATGKTKGLFQAIHGQLGVVPKLYQGIASSPAALEGYLGIGEALKHGSLSFKEREAVALVISQANECQYCLSAHSALGKMAGLKDSQVLDIRRGQVEDSKLKVLTDFAKIVLERKGRINTSELEKIRAAGYRDSAITETILVIAQTVFTNFFNQVAGTEIDFPLAEAV